MHLTPIPLSTALQLRRKAVMILHGQRCRYCGGEASEIDHIIPKSKGGGDESSNLVAACKACNCSKGDTLLPADVSQKIRVDAWIMAPTVDELVERMWEAEMYARERRQYIKPWKVA